MLLVHRLPLRCVRLLAHVLLSLLLWRLSPRPLLPLLSAPPLLPGGFGLLSVLYMAPRLLLPLLSAPPTGRGLGVLRLLPRRGVGPLRPPARLPGLALVLGAARVAPLPSSPSVGR